MTELKKCRFCGKKFPKKQLAVYVNVYSPIGAKNLFCRDCNPYLKNKQKTIKKIQSIIRKGANGYPEHMKELSKQLEEVGE
jgi:hypothetical protein